MILDSLASWINQQFVSMPSAVVVLFGLALLVSSIGFYRTVLFISIGYAFSITVLSVAVVFMLKDNLNWVSILQNVLLLIWSLRLGLYLTQREFLPSFGPQKERNRQQSINVPRKAQFAIWISVSLLYVAMFSPSLFRLANTTTASTPFNLIPQVLGLIVMFGGMALEGLADKQKSDFKMQHPTAFCNVGLYRWVRCPNYLGEILFWVGNWIVGIAFYTSVLQWAISLVGLICITLIMMGSTKRLESSQDTRYGNLPEYQQYIRNVPVLVPFVPLYTLKHVRVYLE